MQSLNKWARAVLVVVGTFVGVSQAEAQMPMPTTATPTLRGGQTMDGIAVSAEVGYPALRVGAYFGSGGFFDVGVEAAAPTYHDFDLNGYFQNVGMDIRVPLRFRLLETSKLVGSLRVAPLFHVGRPVQACGNRGANCDPNVGLGTTIGFMMDIPLPKIFKLVIGPDTRWGFLSNNDTWFAGSVVVNLGIEALWKQLFFTLYVHLGASYIADDVDGAEPVFREYLGVGYHF